MRRFGATGILGLLLMIVPAAAAQAGSGAAEEVRISDPSGDVIIRNANQNVSAPAGTYQHVDLRSVWISNETETSFEVGFRLERWEDPTNGQDASSRYVQAGFSFLEQSYAAQFGPGLDGTPCPPNQGTLIRGRFDGASSHRVGKYPCLNATVEAATAIVHLEIPKNLIKSHNGLPLQIGDSITRLGARAAQLAGFGLASDRAPDEGFGDAFVLRRGVTTAGGDLSLLTKVPVRASNGESTTMVFRVRVANQGTEEHVVSIAADVANPEWQVRVPPRLRVPAQSAVDFPAILSMNFSHEHGTTQFFTVTATSLSDPTDTTKIELGVHWLEIPQPAGHHDRLWIHSSPRSDHPYDQVNNIQRVWMNSVETDPRGQATQVEIPGHTYYPCSHPQFTGCATDTQMWWQMGLDPALQIGLDLDESRPGSMEVRIRPTMPANRATVNVTLYYCDPNATLRSYDLRCSNAQTMEVLAGQSSPDVLVANTEKTFVVPLHVNASIGQVAFEPGRNLQLFIRLRADTPQGASAHYRAPNAMLVPRGSELTLPLFEYHDPIDQSFQDIASIQLDALDAFDKPVNAGHSVVFRFDLTNVGAEAHELELSAEGINAEWARIHEGDRLRLGPQERRQVTVIVEAPDDAQAGERAELFFVAESTRDPSIVTLGRIRATVVDYEVPDETPTLAVGGDSDTPAPAAAWTLAAVTALAFLLRRRR